MIDYLITPSPELREQWLQSPHDALVQAAQWGADQELEACCNWLPKLPPWSGEDLRRDRRCLAAALRALAFNVYSDEVVTCGGSSYALVIERDDILAIAAELEGAE